MTTEQGMIKYVEKFVIAAQHFLKSADKMKQLIDGSSSDKISSETKLK